MRINQTRVFFRCLEILKNTLGFSESDWRWRCNLVPVRLARSKSSDAYWIGHGMGAGGGAWLDTLEGVSKERLAFTSKDAISGESWRGS